jgi:hypothetical protein
MLSRIAMKKRQMMASSFCGSIRVSFFEFNSLEFICYLEFAIWDLRSFKAGAYLIPPALLVAADFHPFLAGT